MAADSTHTVFISSTFEDLREERAAVQKAVLRLGCLPIGMELFPSADSDAWGFIKGEIERSDYYVLIVGGRYGSVAEDGVSYTEKEYRYARELNKPSLVFIRSAAALVGEEKREQDSAKREKLERFVIDLNAFRLGQRFNNSDQLGGDAYFSLTELRNKHPAPGYWRANHMPTDAAKSQDPSNAEGRSRSILSFASYPDSSFREYFRNAKNIELMGLSLFRFVPLYYGDIQEALKVGASLRVLLTDPSSHAVEMAAFRSETHSTAEGVRGHIVSVCKFLKQQIEEHRDYKIEIRLMAYLAPYSIVLVHPDRLEGKTYCHARLLPFRTPSMKAPLIRPDDDSSSEWSRYFQEQFKSLWNASTPA